MPGPARLRRRDGGGARPLRRPLAEIALGSPRAWSRAPGSARGSAAMPGSMPARGLDRRDRRRRARVANLAAEIRSVARSVRGGMAPDPGRQLYRRPARALGLGRFVRQIRLSRAVPEGRKAMGRQRVHPRSRCRAAGSAARSRGWRTTSTATSRTCCSGSTAIPRAGARPARERRYRQLWRTICGGSSRGSGNAMSRAAAIAKAYGLIYRAVRGSVPDPFLPEGAARNIRMVMAHVVMADGRDRRRGVRGSGDRLAARRWT